ncbi:hypothetical protein MAPG_03315 [Magnaporthiopsis poae ATCC 64411]|uniref:LysM domain-containing protein n=1 Tax=Magnaporthiopsis poae (strain ATCC 64411 / 73-15) TaxID=644358 RepID=A0A0C4DTP4_MAGP6|nr:hypothetical protein MAPG_03315 [Magnaporthiopsis poae ATCC 64411]
MEESCCTCATLLSDSRRRYAPAPADDSDGSGSLNEKQLSEKEKGGEVVPDRRLECCARVICRHCLDKNVRFATYCPYCQISTEGHDLSIPSAGLRNPPSYDGSAAAPGAEKKESQQEQQCRPLTPPPPYTAATTEKQQQPDEPPPPLQQNEDVLHFLDHAHDTIPSLSLRYNIPAAALRAANRLGSDHLLLGRRVIHHHSSNPYPPTR